MEVDPDAQGQLTPQSLVRSSVNFELVRDVMDVLVTCKYEEYPIKNEGARSGHNIIHQYFRRSRTVNSAVGDSPNWPKFELV